MGKEKTRSPFSIAGPLSQVFCLGVLSQRLNRKLVFDRDTKQITNDPEANKMLCGVPPRKRMGTILYHLIETWRIESYSLIALTFNSLI